MAETSSEDLPVHRFLVISKQLLWHSSYNYSAEITPPLFSSLFALAFTAPIAKKVDWIFWDVTQHLSCLKLDCFAWDYLIIVLES